MLDCVVSLTTWKGRINDIAIAKIIFRLLEEQTTDYNYKVVLVLSKEEFGEDYVLPEHIELLLYHPKFELLWTYDNTKALKKLDPTMEKYPDIPIITMDDDELVSTDCIQKIMDEHYEFPNDILGGEVGVCHGIYRPWLIRLFPPHSLKAIPTEYFKTYFNCMQDDEWNGLRAKLNNTKIRKLKSNVVINIFCADQTHAFNKEYNNFDFEHALNKFKTEHSEYFNYEYNF